MRRFILLLGIFVSSLQAQDLSYTYSEAIPIRHTDEYEGLLHYDSTGYTINLYERRGKGVLGEPGKVLILEKYNTALKQEFSYEYGGESEGRNSVGLLSNGQKFIWIVLDKVNPYRYKYRMIPISLNGKEGASTDLLAHKVEKEADILNTEMILSKDSSYISFIAYFDANKKRRDAEVYTAVIGPRGELVWDGHHVLKGNQKQYEFLDQIVTATGEVLLLVKYYRDAKAKDKIENRAGQDQAGYELRIIKIDAEGINRNLVNLDLKGQFLHDAKLTIDDTNHLICTGFLASNHRGPLSGVFYRKINQSYALEKQSTHVFKLDNILDLGKAKLNVEVKSKDKRGLDRNFDMGEILLLEDGALILTAEENDLRRRTDFNPNFNYGAYDPFYNGRNRESLYLMSDDVISIYVDEEGNIGEEILALQKKQTAFVYSNYGYLHFNDRKLKEQELFLSYSPLNINGSIYYIFNDHFENIDREGKKKLKDADRLDKMETYFKSLSVDGEPRDYLFDKAIGGYLLSPSKSQQINKHQYFFSLIEINQRKERGLRIGILEF